MVLFVLIKVEKSLVDPSLALIHALFKEELRFGRALMLNPELREKSFCFAEIKVEDENEVAEALALLKEYSLSVHECFYLSKDTKGILFSMPIMPRTEQTIAYHQCSPTLPLSALDNLSFIVNYVKENLWALLVYHEDKRDESCQKLRTELMEFVNEHKLPGLMERNSF